MKTMTNSMASKSGSFFLGLALASFIVVAFASPCRAGGPKYVAGTSYFDATVAGQPLVWPAGTILYYTDQGDLSPVLPNASANAFVATAFGQWTSIRTAALAASSPGQLGEDVNGTNVYVNSDGTISMPADIQSNATVTPIGIVYDYDGSVTNALIGAGAGNASQCASNAAFGGADNFGTLASYQHALIVINGQCALQSSQLTDVEYRLVRVIGQVLGLGWSQVNPNVLTGNPPATSDDYAGFPVMHYKDPHNCMPVTLCYPNPLQPAMDDVAALSRLYPVTLQNQSNFPGKQVFAAATARIHGSVWFTDRSGNATQPMQGVNVVARWIDPTTGKPSRRYVASSVSGFLFTGNAGNPITGFTNSLGVPFADWGSAATSVEGFFDVGGLQLPNGGTAQYQLTVEALDGTWSTGVGPYAPMLVTPSGSAQAITVTLSAGQDVEQDIRMTGSSQPLPSAVSTWCTPAAIPSGGDWVGSLGSYGQQLYYSLPVQANRTLSVAMTALDDSGNDSELKLQPVTAIWSASDPQGTLPSAFTSSAFNTITPGLTRLDAQFAASGNFIIGMSDIRGDGRPDYHFHAHVLYADSVSPTRLPVSGGTIAIRGTGLSPALKVAIGSTPASQIATNSGELILAAPAHSDSVQSITVSDPASGSFSNMANVLTYGAAATDTISLLALNNPSTPVGVQAPYPLRVQVLAADGVTPVFGATVAWSASNGLQLSACNNASSCTAVTDQSGIALTWLTPANVGASTITATLAPGAYSSSKSVVTTLNGTETSSDIGVLNPIAWIPQLTNATVPITVRVLSNGTPQSNATVGFTVVAGTGTLSAATAQTNSNGYATVSLSMTQINSLIQVSACIEPANAPCKPFNASPVPMANLKLQPVSGATQVSTGQAFQPFVLRVTDSATPPNLVVGAAVTFVSTVLRPGGSLTIGGSSETNTENSAMPVILKATQTTALSDSNGLVSVLPASGGFSAPLEINISASAGTNASANALFPVMPAPLTNNQSQTTNQPQTRHPPRRLPYLDNDEALMRSRATSSSDQPNR